MRCAPLLAVALSACSYDRAFEDYCIDVGACSCNETTCCIQHGFSCHTGYACCDGFVCNGQTGTCRRPADAVLEVTPAECDFGWVPVGQSTTLTATVKNTGLGPSSPLTFGDVRAPFRMDLNPCSGQVLAPGASCDVQMSVQPTTAGYFSDLLRIEELVSKVQTLLKASSEAPSVTIFSYNVAAGSILSDPPILACPPADYYSSCTATFSMATQVTIERGSPIGPGYYFGGFFGDCPVWNATTCSVWVDRPRTLYVQYIPNLTLTVGPGGAVDVAGTAYAAYSSSAWFWVPADGGTALTAEPRPPSQFTGWGGACAPAGLDAGCFLDIAGPVSVSASFAP